MKRYITLFISIIMLIICAGCTATPSATEMPKEATAVPSATPTPTPTPKPDFAEESIDINELGDYAIVYPSDYAEWQMTDVCLLQKTIEKITGKLPKLVTDGETATEKEIVLASSKRKTSLSEYVGSFESRLDYVIGVQDGKLILGGQDYYGDMRAIYSFINGYLGYDDVQDTYSQAKANVSGVNEMLYVAPDFSIAAGCFYKTVFPNKLSVRDVKDSGFNMIIIQGAMSSYETEESFRELAVWCARFELQLVLPVSVDRNEWTFKLKYYDAYEDNPIVYGHYIVDEPAMEYWIPFGKIGEEYKALYNDKGWKAIINIGDIDGSFFSMTEELDGILNAYDVISFDHYFAMGARTEYYTDGVGTTNDVIRTWQIFQAYAESCDADFWSYVMAYYLDRYNYSKMLRWNGYICMCFDVDCIPYFNYTWQVVDKNYNRLDYWYAVKEANENIMFVENILKKDYSYSGTLTLNAKAEDKFVYVEQNLSDTDKYIVQESDPFEKKPPYLVGCFDSNDGEGYALVIVNMEPLDNTPYSETTGEKTRFKFNGENVRFYKDCVEQEVEKDTDGYYLLELANGFSWLIIVE